jgi:hypothetical protein
LSIEGIVSWVSMVEPVEMRGMFEDSGVVGGLGWRYGEVLGNLKKDISM